VFSVREELIFLKYYIDQLQDSKDSHLKHFICRVHLWVSLTVMQFVDLDHQSNHQVSKKRFYATISPLTVRKKYL
jgi:hypothetical protein